MSDPTPDPLLQNLRFHKVSKAFVCIFNLEKYRLNSEGSYEEYVRPLILHIY